VEQLEQATRLTSLDAFSEQIDDPAVLVAASRCDRRVR
jgi:hypothetical protein